MSADIAAVAERSDASATDGTAGDSFRLSVVLLIVVMLAQRLIGLGRNVFLCGMLTEEELGRWSLANNYLGWAAPFVVLGLPGSFGRLSEHFRQRGELRRFLQETAGVTVALMAIATLVHFVRPSWFARMIYNNSEQIALIPVLGLVLCTVIALNFLVEFLTSVRCNRVVSRIYLVQSLLFAVLSVAFLAGTSLRELGVLVAFGLSSAVAAGIGLMHVVQHWRDAPVQPVASSTALMWRRIVTLACWIWIGNSIANFFDFSDQFLLKHCLPLAPDVADAMVGQLYASRVLPVLIVSVAVLTGGCLLPYLIKDMESGRPEQANERMNSVIKYAALGFTAIGAATHLASPLVFAWILRGKHAESVDLMPWGFVQYSWFGLAMVAGRYLICVDRPRVGILPLALGLVTGAVLVVTAAPRWGLSGVVVGMTIANGVAFFALLWITGRCGMKWDGSTLVAAWTPLALSLGGGPALLFLAVLLGLSWRHGWLFTTAEREQIQEAVSSATVRLRVVSLRSTPAMSRK